MQRTKSLFTSIVRAIVPRTIRNAIRKPGTTLERAALKWKRLKGETAEAKPLPEWAVRCHPLCVGEFEVFQRDDEQRMELRSFIQHCGPATKLLDIGTHWGAFSLAALHFGGPDARVIGIEASEDAAKVYRDNITINDATSRTTLINAACGAEVGELKMLTTGAGGADYFVVPADDRPDTISVPQVTADSVCATHGFKPTLLKIDVEGFEEEVLRGAQGTLKSHKPVIFLELHGDLIARRGKEATSVLELLNKCGYSRWLRFDGSDLDGNHLAELRYNARFISIPSSS